MMEAVHRYEGTVNQAMGDGIMPSSGRRWMRITLCGPLRRAGHADRPASLR